METTTPLLYSCALGYDVHAALELIMQGDDELMSDYVNLALISAMTEYVNIVGPRHHSPFRWGLINEHLERARRAAKAGEDDMISRFKAQAEPPF